MSMPTITRRRVLLYLAVAAAALTVGVRFLGPAGQASPTTTEAVVAELVAEPPPAAAAPEELVVHIAGAVRKPGIYRLPVGSRIDDAIREAGGARPRAALEAVNLAALVSDGQQVIVPRRDGSPISVPGNGVAAPSAPGPVSLSTATLEELDALPGVGPVTARSIVEYREENGGFSSVDELDAVPGIGPARLEQLRELVVP